MDGTSLEVIRQTYQEDASELVDLASALQKKRYDKRHSPVDFKVGDTVYLRLGKGYHLLGKPSKRQQPARAGPFTPTES